MVDISNLMLKREHFPIQVINREGGARFRDSVQIPPYHHSMHANGIDLDIAVSVLDEALENIVLDLEGLIKSGLVYIKYELGGLQREASGKIIRGDVHSAQDYRYINPFPFIRHLHIARKKISPYVGDHYIMISEHAPSQTFLIPSDVPLTPELIDEYKIKIEGKSRSGDVVAVLPFNWAYHNVYSMGIFYKNFVIAINNEVVRRKYSK